MTKLTATIKEKKPNKDLKTMDAINHELNRLRAIYGFVLIPHTERAVLKTTFSNTEMLLNIAIIAEKLRDILFFSFLNRDSTDDMCYMCLEKCYDNSWEDVLESLQKITSIEIAIC